MGWVLDCYEDDVFPLKKTIPNRRTKDQTTMRIMFFNNEYGLQNTSFQQNKDDAHKSGCNASSQGWLAFGEDIMCSMDEMSPHLDY